MTPHQAPTLPSERPSDAMQPLAFGSYRNWRRVAREGGGVDPGFVRRALFVSAVSLATAPVRAAERLARRTWPAAASSLLDPVFVVGHWRSGTTHLHNLLCADPQFGWLTTFQSLAPEMVHAGWHTVRPLMAWRMPPTRVVDEMPQAIDGPTEDEWALANRLPYSSYHHFSFPRRFRHFERYNLLEDVAPGERAAWRAAYLDVLATASSQAGGRRLVLKNPANTGRVPALREIFPGARIVHVVRNPYDVFASTSRLYDTLYGICALQTVPRAEVEENILGAYERMMAKLLADRDAVPPGQFAEVRYEELALRPLDALERLYAELRLGGFEDARPHMHRHLAATSGHRPAAWRLDPATAARVAERWRFAFEAWRYPVRTAP